MDELDVKLKIVLDEQSLEEQGKKASEKVFGTKPPPPSSSPQRPDGREEISILKQIKDAISKKEERLGGFGGLAAPLAAGFFGLGILKQVKDAVLDVLSSLWGLASSLQRFSPEISLAMRQWDVAMRQISIDLARRLGPALADLVKAFTELVSVIYDAVKDLLPILTAAIKVITFEIKKWATIISTSVRMVETAILALVKTLTYVTRNILNMIGMSGSPVGQLVEKMDKTVDKWLEAIREGRRDNSGKLLNDILIKGLMVASHQKWTGVSAPTTERFKVVRPSDIPSELAGPGRPTATVKSPTSMTAVPVSKPFSPVANFNVKQHNEFSVSNERAIESAVRDVRKALMAGVMRAEDALSMAVNRSVSETVVDLVY